MEHQFAGWGATGSITPDELIQSFFQQLADNAAVAQSGQRTNVLDQDITKVYLTDNGVDLKQMIQKVLLMTVAFSQGADDYLDLDLVDANSVGQGNRRVQ